jgi:hypothetical protein
MYTFLEALWPAFAQSRPHCAASEVDVAGLNGISLLEWLGEPARECADVVDHRWH